MKRAKGFTLLELMIVVGVIAILAALALSGYQKQIRKSRRAEAKQVLADFSLRQEKYRSNNANYATCDVLLSPTTCASYNLTLAYYTVAVAFPSSGNCPLPSGTGPAKGNANSYILTATPKSTTDQSKDTSCATLLLTNDCGTLSKTSTGGGTCW